MNYKIACIVPTYNGALCVQRLFESLLRQSIKADLFVVDSSSSDDTLELAQGYCDRVTSIPSMEFNHGGTRQLIVEQNIEYDIYVFLTQDAYLESDRAIENIVAPFSDEKTGAVCGRQLPHFNANAFSCHARAFNYPENRMVKSMANVSELGIKTAFISNSFAAYRREALMEVGGFPKHVIFAEDMYVAAKMLLAGWKVAYEGSAECRHSHNYTIAEEFRRYFDMGVFHAREPWIRQSFGGAGGEGMRYVISELKYLGFKRLHLWPGALVRNAAKLLGYKLGQNERRLPKGLKQKIGMYKHYWTGPYAEKS